MQLTDLIYIPISVEITRDIAKNYDNMKNVVLFYHNVKTMMQKSSSIGMKIKFNSEQISESRIQVRLKPTDSATCRSNTYCITNIQRYFDNLYTSIVGYPTIGSLQKFNHLSFVP